MIKYSILFLILGGLIFYFGTITKFIALSLCLFWFSLDLLLISLSYLLNKTSILGKKSNGNLGVLNLIALFPYFLFTWIVWRFSLIVDKSKPFNQLAENIWIGRRLLQNEEIQGIDLVLDLTCEFSESRNLITVKEYLSFTILDAGVPDENKLKSLLNYIKIFNGKIYIHCAQGSGRTGVVTCGYLLFTGKAKTVEEAYRFVKSKRPSVKLNSNQMHFLRNFLIYSDLENS